MIGDLLYNIIYGFGFFAINIAIILSTPNVFLNNIDRKSCGDLIDEEIKNTNKNTGGVGGFVIFVLIYLAVMIYYYKYGKTLIYFNWVYFTCALISLLASLIMFVKSSKNIDNLTENMDLPSCRDNPNNNCDLTDENVDEKCIQNRECKKSCRAYYIGKGDSTMVKNICMPELEGFNTKSYKQTQRDKKKEIYDYWIKGNLWLGFGVPFIWVLPIGPIMVGVGAHILNKKIKKSEYNVNGYKPGRIALYHILLIICYIILLSVGWVFYKNWNDLGAISSNQMGGIIVSIIIAFVLFIVGIVELNRMGHELTPGDIAENEQIMQQIQYLKGHIQVQLKKLDIQKKKLNNSLDNDEVKKISATIDKLKKELRTSTEALTKKESQLNNLNTASSELRQQNEAISAAAAEKSKADTIGIETKALEIQDLEGKSKTILIDLIEKLKIEIQSEINLINAKGKSMPEDLINKNIHNNNILKLTIALGLANSNLNEAQKKYNEVLEAQRIAKKPDQDFGFISVTNSSIWRINKKGDVFKCTIPSCIGNWQKVNDKPYKQVIEDGENIWGLGTDNILYKKSISGSNNWVPIHSGHSIMYISKDNKANSPIYLLNVSNILFKMDSPYTSISEVDTTTLTNRSISIKQISVDETNIWGVGNNGELLRKPINKEADWLVIPIIWGALLNISASDSTYLYCMFNLGAFRIRKNLINGVSATATTANNAAIAATAAAAAATATTANNAAIAATAAAAAATSTTANNAAIASLLSASRNIKGMITPSIEPALSNPVSDFITIFFTNHEVILNLKKVKNFKQICGNSTQIWALMKDNSLWKKNINAKYADPWIQVPTRDRFQKCSNIENYVKSKRKMQSHLMFFIVSLIGTFFNYDINIFTIGKFLLGYF